MTHERFGDHIVYPSIPAMFQAKTRELAAHALTFRKEHGAWRAYTGQHMNDSVRRWTWGLLALGVKKGDKVAVISSTRMEWALADFAILHAGGVTVGIYPSLLADDVAYQLEHSEARIVFCENKAQLEKVQSIRSKCPRLEHAILFESDPENHDYTFVIPFDDLEARGDSHERFTADDGPEPRQPGDAFERAWKALGPDDLATIIYTSGTTGPPKGALLSHGNLCFVVASASSAIPSRGQQDFGLSFLPMAHALQRVGNYVATYNGTRGAFAESIDKILDNFRELRPTVQVSVPRIWEKLYTKINAGLAQAPWHRRKIFAWMLAVGRESAPYRKRNQEVPGLLGWKWSLARKFFRSKVWPKLGFERVRFLSSGGAPIGLELLEFFYAMDLLILEAWGLTETAAPATLNRIDDFKFGTVGKAIPGVEVRVAPEDGELLVRGAGVFKGYYKDEAATKAAFDEQGYFRTGDIGEIDGEGFVKITDRKKNLIVTSAGKKIPPQNLENVFKECPYLGPCLIHGDRRKFLTAIFTLDKDEITAWAKDRGFAGDLAAIAGHDETKKLVAQAVEKANAKLATYEQVKRWAVVGDEWSDKTGELTPTLKIKRKVLEDRYRTVLESFYEGEGT
jgi:long-chain acyl-CoA synthetase